ncbi:MAG: SRPBCC domain-containing protein [Dehalococcoidia bacterium]|nr:SRPBCC domain-containing protein [Dehalococcoidia bacterium]
MAKAEKVFIVAKPLDEVWAFLYDMEKVGSCLPGCEKVQVLNELESEWTIKLKIGPISKTILARARTTESSAPSHAAFVVEAPEMQMEGSLDLRSVSPDQTEVTYRSNAKARGPLEQLLEQIIAGRLGADAETFANNVRLKLEGGGAAPGGA